MKEREKYGKGLKLTDGAQDGMVKTVNTNTEQQDVGRLQIKKEGSKGYPSEAWNYKY